MTFIVREAFRARYGGEDLTFPVGERWADEHPLAADPEIRKRLEYVADEPSPFQPGTNGHAAPARSTGGRPAPRPRMTAEQQQAIRTARLREIERREAEGWGGGRADPEDVFWSGVARLLGTDGPDDVEREGSAVIDLVESTQANVARSTVEELSEWLDW
jgi:hypothetical protein